MNYESMWNKLKSKFVLSHAELDKEGKHAEAKILEIVLDEMVVIEEYEEVKTVMK